MFCGERFTIAKVKKQDRFRLLKDDWEKEEISLEEGIGHHARIC
jgi:hypothetical protein